MRRREFIALFGSAVAWPLWRAPSSRRCRSSVFSAVVTERTDLRHARVPPGSQRGGLRRWSQHRYRIPLGGRPLRAIAGVGRRSGQPASRGDRRDQRHRLRRLRRRRRPRRFRSCLRSAATPSLPGWSPTSAIQEAISRGEFLYLPGGDQTIGIGARTGPPRDNDCHAREPGQSTKRRGKDDPDRRRRRLWPAIPDLNASDGGHIDDAFAAIARQRIGALIVSSDPLFFIERKKLVVLSSRHVLPTIFADREQAEAGGLISYGASDPRPIAMRAPTLAVL